MDRTKVPSKLFAWRDRNGLTLREVADLTGLSESMLSRAERGLRNLSPFTKVQVARRLGVDVSELFELEALEEADDASA